MGVRPSVFGSLVVAGDFTETDNCAGQTLAVGSSCSVQIVFAPRPPAHVPASSPSTRTLPGGQATVSLSGTGTAAAAIILTPLTLNFRRHDREPDGRVPEHHRLQHRRHTRDPIRSRPQRQRQRLCLFANTCGATLAAGTGCTLAITFTPTASGARSATLSITDNAGTSSAATQTASLSGIGEAPATDTLSASR